MAGNPNWWSNMHPPSYFPPPPPPHEFVLGSSSSLPFNSLPDNQDPPQSWSQLLLGGMSAGDEERFAQSHFQPKKSESWEDSQLVFINNNNSSTSPRVPVVDVFKQEVSQNSDLYGQYRNEEIQASRPAWSTPLMMMASSSPRSSCVTSSLSSNNDNMLYFSSNKVHGRRSQSPDHSISECNSTATGGGACKKTRVQPSSSQPPLKVRKEKLGDRITALHQLVSPFGKTDTASVLLEAIGYIRFLQGQIEALSSPYLANASKNTRNPQPVQGERNGVFPEEPGQLLNDACLKRKVTPRNQEVQEKKGKDLRSRGLCLVPVSCTQHVGSENGADYWAPAYGGGF